MAQLQTAIDSIINKSKLPFYKAIKGAEARVAAAELAYVEILLSEKADNDQHLFNAARTENYVKGILETLKARYKEAYGVDFDDNDFEVRKLDVVSMPVTTIVALKGTLPSVIRGWDDITVPYVGYSEGVAIYASNTVK